MVKVVLFDEKERVPTLEDAGENWWKYCKSHIDDGKHFDMLEHAYLTFGGEEYEVWMDEEGRLEPQRPYTSFFRDACGNIPAKFAMVGTLVIMKLTQYDEDWNELPQADMTEEDLKRIESTMHVIGGLAMLNHSYKGI